MSTFTRVTTIVAVLSIASCAMAGVFTDTSRARDIPLGRECAREVESRNRLSTNQPLVNRVQRLGQLLSDSFQAKPYPYSFKVLDLPTFNAFALPGGPIYVHEGLLHRLQSDDALCFILAHEMAHCNERHWAEKTKRNEVVGLLVLIATGGSVDITNIVTALVGASYSREKEREADQRAVEYVWQAGLGVDAAVRGAEALLDFAGDEKYGYLRTHPPAQDRLRLVKVWADEYRQKQPPPPPEVPTVDPSALAEIIPPPPDAIVYNKYYPLALGNKWHYVCTSKGSSARTEIALEVVAAVPVAEGSVFRMQLTTRSGTARTFDLATDAVRVWRRNPTDQVRPWQLDCGFPPEGDATGEMIVPGYIRVGLEPLELPHIKLEQTLHVQKVGPDGTLVSDHWYAPGIGLVKRTHANGVSETLEHHNVQPEPAATAGTPLNREL